MPEAPEPITPPAPAAPAAAPATPATPKPTAPDPATPAPVDTTDWKAAAEKAAAEKAAAEAEAEKWKGLSRKHERRQLEALGFDEATAEKILAERATKPKALAEKVAGYDELAARIEAVEKDRDTARHEAEVARAISTYHVPDDDAPLLEGLSGETLTSLAKRLGQEPKQPPAAPGTAGAGKVGTPVTGPKQIATREEYAALSPEERRAARKDGRLNQLLGATN